MTKKTSRQIALERRIAMSDGGKKSLANSSTKQDRVRSASDARLSPTVVVKKSSVVSKNNNPVKKRHIPQKNSTLTSRQLVLQRRKALSTHGKPAMNSSDRTRSESASKKNNETSVNLVDSKAETPVKVETSLSVQKVNQKRRIGPKKKVIANTSRDIVLARREAQSKHGKSAIKQNPSAASLARRGDPDLSSKEIALRVRELRSKTGASSIKGNGKCRPCGPNRNGAKQKADAHWKVGESGTNSGQTVTGTQANRSSKTTGNESSTCRDITGTQYLGTEVINEFCNSDLSYKQPSKINVSSTTSGNRVTGNEVGRSSLVTGNEPGTCKNLTGTEYTSANLSQSYCGEINKTPSKIRHSKTLDGQNVSGSLPGRSSLVTGDESGSGHQLTGDQYLGADPLPDGKSFEKVGAYNTLNGNLVTGTGVGRSERMTGNESGSCKNITGDEYIGSQQYESFCGAKPTAEARKVGLSISPNNNFISGTMTGRSDHVTGDEPGTCKNVTGTPYAGVEQLENNCDPNTKNELRGKGKVYLGNSSNARLTGKQPGIGGQLTGAGKGACLNPTGTPYVGGDQLSSNCSNHESTQSFANDEKEKHNTWNDFSVHSPSRERYSEKMRDSVTGNQYESGSNITGPFDMAVDKVTGTEQFRFDKNKLNTVKPKEDNQDINLEEERAQSRITGEGQSAGLNITGDDWARGDRVTGTEGASSRRRNPSRASLMNAMPPMDIKRNEKMKEPDFLITGSSGNTKEGQLVTFSGGARG